jgi:hypothetical protein
MHSGMLVWLEKGILGPPWVLQRSCLGDGMFMPSPV